MNHPSILLGRFSSAGQQDGGRLSQHHRETPLATYFKMHQYNKRVSLQSYKIIYFIKDILDDYTTIFYNHEGTLKEDHLAS